MAIERRQVLHSVTQLANGVIEAKWLNQVVDDGEVIASTPLRRAIAPDEPDYTDTKARLLDEIAANPA